MVLSLTNGLSVGKARAAEDGGYRLTWVFLILMFPVFGGVLYVFLNTQMTTAYYAKNLQKTVEDTYEDLPGSEEVRNEVEKLFPEYLRNVDYLQNTMHFPIYKNTKICESSPIRCICFFASPKCTFPAF